MIIHNAYDLLYLHNQLNKIVNIYHYANHYINSMFITLEKQHHILLKSILHTIGKAIFYFPFPSTMSILSISMYFANINILLSISIYSADIYFMFHLCTLRTAVSCPSVLSDLLRASSAIFLYLSICDCCDAFVR